EWRNDWFGCSSLGWFVFDIRHARLYCLRLGAAAGGPVRPNHAPSAKSARTNAAIVDDSCFGTFDGKVYSRLLALGRLGTMVLPVIRRGFLHSRACRDENNGF